MKKETIVSKIDEYTQDGCWIYQFMDKTFSIQFLKNNEVYVIIRIKRSHFDIMKTYDTVKDSLKKDIMRLIYEHITLVSIKKAFFF